MSKICYFYSTKKDILGVTEQLESSDPIKYVRFGQTTKLPPESYSSAMQIPHLGIATHPSSVGCEKYLVCDPETTIRPRPLKTLSESDVNRSIIPNKEPLIDLIGVERYALDQLFNPNTITFSSGGLWKDQFLLHGGIGTASQSEFSEELMKRFLSAIKKSFIKIKAFYVGPQALELLKNGTRLTISAQSPLEFDLKI